MKQGNGMRLWLLLTVLVNSIIAVAFIGFGAYTAHHRVHELKLAMEIDLRNMARSISVQASDSLLAGSYDEIESLLLNLIHIGSNRDIVVANAQGRIVSQVQRDANGVVRVVYAQAVKPLDATRRESSGQDSFAVIEPIVVGERIGWVQVSSDLSSLRAAERDTWMISLTAALLTLLVTSSVLAYVLRKVSKALVKSSQFAQDLVQHQGKVVPTQSRISELVDLRGALNQASLALKQQFDALQDSEVRKGAILETSLDCLITIDAEGRIVDFNTAAEATFGWMRREVIGANMGEIIIPPAHRAAHAQGMRHHAATGEGPILRKRIEISAQRRDGSEFPAELTVAPFVSGGQKYFLGSLRDISESKALEAERQRISTLLQQSFNDLSAKQLALDEHAIVSITDAQGTIVYANEKFRQISQYSREELLGKNHRILNSGLQDASFFDDLWSTISAGQVWHGEIANRRKNGDIYWVASTIVPTLGTDGLPREYISIRTDITDQKRVQQQFQFASQSLERLVEQYRATQIELGQARAQELEIGHQIQRSMLLGDVPGKIGAVSLAAHTEPSQGIDGDFYECFSYGPDQFDLSIGDVMGKGVSAALIGAAVKQQMNQTIAEQLAHYCLTGTDPPDPASMVNALHEKVSPQLMALESFVTLAYLRVDMSSNRVSLVDAGHTASILANAQGSQLISGVNLPLGVLAEEVYQQQVIDVHPGDVMFLYSDGFTEARSSQGEEFGVERLRAMVQGMQVADIPVKVLVQAIRKAVRDFEAREFPSDDRTCLALRFDRTASGGTQTVSLDLLWSLDALAQMRQSIKAFAAAAGVDEAARDALTLAAFEVATNVIRHADQALRDISLHVRLEDKGDSVDVSLYYVGERFDPEYGKTDFSGVSEGGFGLYIIRNSVSEVVYDSPAPSVARVRLSQRKDRQPSLDVSS